MRWIKKLWQRIESPKVTAKELPKVTTSEKPKKSLFAVGKKVCFLHKVKDREVYGIGEIKNLKSKPVLNNSGQIESFLYVADIQPLYEVPHTWTLPPVTEEHCSDDYLPFPLPDEAILSNRLEMRMKLPESKSNYKLLKAVPGRNFCLANYYDFLHFSSGITT